MDLINTEEWMFFITIAILISFIIGYVFGMLDGKDGNEEFRKGFKNESM